MRSTLNREEAIERYNMQDLANNTSVNQAVLTRVIRIENYSSELSNIGLTSTTDSDGANGDIKKSKFSQTGGENEKNLKILCLQR